VAAAVSTTVSAATTVEASSTAVLKAAPMGNRGMIEVVVMAAKVVMLFPRVTVGKVRRIAAASVTVRRVSIRGIVGIAIAAPTAAAVAAAAIEASAESAET
jgi:hypothetical protein